ncbi:uncharacterized protein LOC127279519 [Leptopilina boulardi]|uniref:uncharacterized protein LOC127279519 n=1 Tax=Leptopilina boulardi TaxID=63433 RepID=UPI0021F66050|nr:uncharacterized protein LOC127279519 [Leptopilina boulardi]
MYKAEFSIKLLTIVGAHRPISWSSFIAKSLYNFFTVFVIIFSYSTSISMCMYLILHSLNNMYDVAESLFWSLAAFVSCFKMVIFLFRREDIIKLINILSEDIFQIRDNKEKIIQDKCDVTARKNTNYFFAITFATALTMIFGGLIKGNDISLPLKASFPYNYNQKAAFCLTYVGQSVFICFSGFITVASETFIMTMLIQICSQLDIIYHRLQSLSYLYRNNMRYIMFNETEEANIIKSCIVHHNYVYIKVVEKQGMCKAQWMRGKESWKHRWKPPSQPNQSEL